MSRRAVALLLPLLFLSACEEDAPPCAGLSPVHATTEGIVEVGPLVLGQTAERVIDVQTSAISGVAETAHHVGFQIDADDAGGTCAMDLECGPPEIEVGDDIACDLTSQATEPGCLFVADLAVTVTHLDSDVCSDAVGFYSIEARQAGR